MILSDNTINYFKAFIGGIGISLTPCVYPLIPVIAGYVSGKTTTSKFKGFTLSLTYVTGIAIVYSLLGLFASLTGKIFGLISSHPLTYIFAGVIIVAFGISMFDLFKIPLANFIKLPQLKKPDYLSVLLLGLASGLVISPCTTPVLGSILFYLATKKNIFYGMTLLLVFAYGMGLVLVLAGTFSSLLVNLPKLGKWMVYIKKAAAVLVIGMGIYFILTGIARF
jgi:thiol:disulfide interchange protein DsbD